MQGTIDPLPDTYTAVATATLLEVFAQGPARLRHALGGLDEAALRAHPRPGKWSILETALHVVDSELVGSWRIRLAYAQPGAAFSGYDQDIWVRAFDHQGADARTLEEALALFTALRRSTLRVFERAGAAAWQRTAVHPERGPLTLRQLLELYADHAERHVEQIREMRDLLGVPVDLASILTPRLY